MEWEERNSVGMKNKAGPTKGENQEREEEEREVDADERAKKNEANIRRKIIKYPRRNKD